MFNFTTTTIVNSLNDLTSGKDLIETKGDVIYIKRHNPFKKDCIVSMIRTKNAPAVCAEIKIADLAEQASDMRIELYIRSVGNADPMFANSLLHKGKPMFIEIPAYTKEDDLVNIANKYNNLMFGGDNQLKASVKSGALVLTCANPYMNVSKATVSTRGTSGEFELLKTLGDAEITANVEGFGDYEHIMKDLRLPTTANLRWKRTMEDEMPVSGGMYDQFILTYRKDRGVMGLGVVGATATSETTHVFWVKSDIADAFASNFTITETRG